MNPSSTRDLNISEFRNASNPNTTDFIRPRGDVKTVLDLTDRDSQDDTLFPAVPDISWFTPIADRKTINFTPQVQTFQYRGPAQWDSRFTFEIDKVSAGDIIHMVALQVRLGHWLDQETRAKLLAGTIEYHNPTADGWTYVNGIGRILIESAEFEVDDNTIERIDTVAADCILKLFPDINNVFGFGRDGVGYTTPSELIEPPSTDLHFEPSGMFDPRRPFTTENGDIFCVVPFFFTRHPYRGAFPLVAINNTVQTAKVRINFNLRKFSDCVRRCSNVRSSCDETPLGRNILFNTLSGSPLSLTVSTSTTPPPFQDVKMIVYSSLISDELRQKYIRNPFDIIYRSIQSFPFSEPLKYAVASNNSTTDSIKIQLPLELNHPIEELVWVIRRKAQNINNDWLNFSSYTEKQMRDGLISDGGHPPIYSQTIIQQEPLVDASIYINSVPVIQQSGTWFRTHIAELHRGGVVPYSSYIYGYSFARKPSAFTPSGTINASRTHSFRLDLTVRVPQPAPNAFSVAESQTWEVFVYGFGINWLRFQNGLCGPIYGN